MTTCGLFDCGACTAPETCGGAGTANVCGEGQCVPDNITPCQGKDCGMGANNCGEPISCGSCTSPNTCGGGGAANICGCTPDNLAACYNKDCGDVTNNCGQTVNCGNCMAPETCGGGGVDNVCGCTPSCVGRSCGQQDDGCGQVCQSGSGCSPCTVHVDSATVALYTFEGAGNTITDEAGQDPGQITGTVTRTAGRPGCGNAVHFERPSPDTGTTNYIEVADSPSWHLPSGSVDFWVRFDALGFAVDRRGIIGRDAVDKLQPGHLAITRTNDGAIVFRMQDTSTSYNECSDPLADGVWHHVGANFGSGGMQLFVNGQLATRIDGTCGTGSGATVGTDANDEPWGFGVYTSHSDQGLITPALNALGGTMDSIRISSTPRDFSAMFP